MTITNERWRYDMRVAIITANTDIYKGTKANESGEAVKLVAEERYILQTRGISKSFSGVKVLEGIELSGQRSIVNCYEAHDRWKNSRSDPYNRRCGM